MQTAWAHTPRRGLWWLKHPLNSAGILPPTPPPPLHCSSVHVTTSSANLNLAHFKVKWCSEQNLTSNNHPITTVHSSVHKKKKNRAGTLPVLAPSSYLPRKIPSCFINCSQGGDGRNWMWFFFFPPCSPHSPNPLNSFSLHKQAVKTERLLNFLWLTQAKNLRHLPSRHQVKTTSFPKSEIMYLHRVHNPVCVYIQLQIIA